MTQESWKITIKDLTKYHRYVLVSANVVVGDTSKKPVLGEVMTLQFNRGIKSTSGEPVVLHHSEINQTLVCDSGKLEGNSQIGHHAALSFYSISLRLT